MGVLAVKIESNVLVITLTNHNRGNRINFEMATELLRAAIQADVDPAVRAVLLNAVGPAFCVGGDLQAFADAPDASAAIKELTAPLHVAISRFARMSKPLVSAVQGPAGGGGFSLAILGDIVVAGASASFKANYTAVGLSPDAACTYLLPKLVGLRRAQELILGNRTLTADEALSWGLVTEIVPDTLLAKRSFDIASRLASGATAAYGAAKALLLSQAGIETQMELESRSIAELAASGDGREGIAAFLEKRPPQFTGD